MNDQERTICARVHGFRKSIKWPQSAFAEEIGLTRNQLAGVEYGRTPLRFGPAANMGRVFDLNLEWLVTGAGPQHGSPPLVSVVFGDDPNRNASLLSQIYAREPSLFTRAEGDVYRPALPPTPGFEPVPFIINHVVRAFQLTKFRSAHEAEVLARGICDFCDNCLQAYRRSGHAVRNKEQILCLPEVTSERNVPPMTEMQALMSQVAKATRAPGKKKELATALGVPAPRVSEWLRKNNPVVPSGETTLRLVKWVIKQELQQNTLGSATNTTKGKTQSRSPSQHESTKSSPKKK